MTAPSDSSMVDVKFIPRKSSNKIGVDGNDIRASRTSRSELGVNSDQENRAFYEKLDSYSHHKDNKF